MAQYNKGVIANRLKRGYGISAAQVSAGKNIPLAPTNADKTK